MNRKLLCAALAAASLGYPMPSALADEASDLSAIRKQLNAMQHEYEAKIKRLETRLAKAERDARAARMVAQAVGKHPVAAAAVSPPKEVATAAPPPSDQLAQAAPAPLDTSTESAPIPEQSAALPPTPPTSQN